MAKSSLGKADRFYKNPAQRDEEWDRYTRPPLWLMVLTIAIVGVAFFAGVYADKPHNIIGWIIGCVAIVIYGILGSVRRRRARRLLRQLHGQAVS
jgi:hypothetical protein